MSVVMLHEMLEIVNVNESNFISYFLPKEEYWLKNIEFQNKNQTERNKKPNNYHTNVMKILLNFLYVAYKALYIQSIMNRDGSN